MTKQFGAGIATGIAGMILVGVVAWLVVVYTGAYNIAASDPHADVVRWTFETTMHRSVSARAGEIALPEQPHLTEAATEWSPGEIHWIVSNGIKMTAMPAFGEHHSPEEMLALTAFVSALPGLSSDDYSALTQSDQGQAEHSQSPPAGKVQK